MIEVRGVEPAALPPAWSEIARHPDFAVAARRLAANMLLLCEDDKQLAAIFKDAGRYVAAMSAAYLHGTGGLSLSLLKQICSRTGFLSPGRASAIIEFLLHIEYLRPASDIAAGHYIPTERFLLAWRCHLQAALDAAAVIEPALGPLSDRLAEPGMFMAFLAIQAARLHTITQEANHFPALTRAFLHPYAGSQILWVMMLSGEETLPTTDEIRLSLADLSRRFDVTHLHVRRLLRQAQDEGMLTYHGRGRFSFEPGGLDELRHHYAFQLSELIESGKAMLAR